MSINYANLAGNFGNLLSEGNEDLPGAAPLLASSLSKSSGSSSSSGSTGVSQAGNTSSLFGMSPAETSAEFANNYSNAESSYAPFPDSGVQSSIGQLQGVYNSVPQAYDVSG